MRKHVQERRVRNCQLAEADMLSRCTFCRRALPKAGVVIVAAISGHQKFCNENCQADHTDALRTMEARR